MRLPAVVYMCVCEVRACSQFPVSVASQFYSMGRCYTSVSTSGRELNNSASSSILRFKMEEFMGLKEITDSIPWW